MINKLVDAAAVQAGDLIVEVGPGTGALTECLLERGCKIIACELDKGLTALLRDRFGEKITLVHGDCLKKKHFNSDIVEAIGAQSWKLVANLPYQIASPLMVDLLSNFPKCTGQFVTIQYEVAERLMAKVNSSNWGVLSILVQRLADVQLITKVPHSCFWPQPKIQSACVAVKPKKRDKIDLNDFALFITALFSKRRKQIGSIVGRSTPLPLGVTFDMRPSTLTIFQLEELYKEVRTLKG